MKRCSSNSSPESAGFTLIETIVAMTVTLAIAAAAMTLALSMRRAYEADQARIGVNRSLRAAGSFLVTDVHQAGERLPGDFPAIEIVDGGAAGVPDQLVVRRNLLASVLRVCSETSGSDDTIQIAWKPTHPSAPPPAGCAPLPDSDGDGWPDDIQAWKEHRESSGGAATAYIYDPVARQGELFRYDEEIDGSEAYEIQRESGAWTHDYALANQPRIYALEERRYRLIDGVLELIVDGETQSPDRLSDRISDFQVRANIDGTHYDSFEADDAWYDWVALRHLEIILGGTAPVGQRDLDRRWTTRVLPRNVMSQ